MKKPQDINIEDLPQDLTVKQLLGVFRALGLNWTLTLVDKPPVENREWRPTMEGTL